MFPIDKQFGLTLLCHGFAKRSLAYLNRKFDITKPFTVLRVLRSLVRMELLLWKLYETEREFKRYNCRLGLENTSVLSTMLLTSTSSLQLHRWPEAWGEQVSLQDKTYKLQVASCKIQSQLHIYNLRFLSSEVGKKLMCAVSKKEIEAMECSPHSKSLPNRTWAQGGSSLQTA